MCNCRRSVLHSKRERNDHLNVNVDQRFQGDGEQSNAKYGFMIARFIPLLLEVARQMGKVGTGMGFDNSTVEFSYENPSPP